MPRNKEIKHVYGILLNLDKTESNNWKYNIGQFKVFNYHLINKRTFEY